MIATILRISGLLIVLTGALTLYRFGMPFRTRSEGKQSLDLEQEDERAKRKEGSYNGLGRLRFLLIAAGTGFQIIAEVV